MVKVNTLPLFLDIFLWYLSSIICTYGTKTLLNSGVVPSSTWLTVAQLFISSIIGWLLLRYELVGEERTNPAFRSLKATRLYWLLAATFVIGFGALNDSMSHLPVSLAMTLRATEPLFSAILAYFLSSETTSLNLGFSLLIIVIGACLSSFGSSEFTYWGLLMVCVANIAFPLRMVLFKQLRDESKEGSFNIFFDVSWRAGAITFCFCLVLELFNTKSDLFKPKESWSVELTKYMCTACLQNVLLIILNGATYFIYLQWSFIVQTKVSIVTHAVCNSMRRPATILFALIMLETNITFANASGIVLASAGALLYAKIKADETRV